MDSWPFRAPATWGREIVARILGLPLGWITGGPRVVGAEHLRAVERPFVISPNHCSHVDSSVMRVALGSAYRQRLAIAAAADYFWRSGRRAFLAGWLGGFPFSREGRGGLESLKAVERLLAAGWSVLIYPEGTRSRSGEVSAFRPGVGFVAVRTGVQVLPVRIVGTAGVLPPGARLPRRQRVEVRLGAPMRAEPGEDARTFTARLEAAVRAL